MASYNNTYWSVLLSTDVFQMAKMHIALPLPKSLTGTAI